MDRRIKRVIVLMEDQFHRELLLDEMAETVRLSPSRLRHLFKEEIGVTPAQYLKSLRMQRAREMMATTFLSVKEIIHRVGMKNKTHFARDFKKTYGVTPSNYLASDINTNHAAICKK
jgi:transcriptional regulator GlxA family with amidase domain